MFKLVLNILLLCLRLCFIWLYIPMSNYGQKMSGWNTICKWVHGFFNTVPLPMLIAPSVSPIVMHYISTTIFLVDIIFIVPESVLICLDVILLFHKGIFVADITIVKWVVEWWEFHRYHYRLSSFFNFM